MNNTGSIFVGFIDTEIAGKYQKLRHSTQADIRVLKLIEKAVDFLKIKPNKGLQIKKEQIPDVYFKKYGIDNLWKYDLSEDWRMIYTITGNGREITVQIIEWFDHKQYDKRFGYN